MPNVWIVLKADYDPYEPTQWSVDSVWSTREGADARQAVLDHETRPYGRRMDPAWFTEIIEQVVQGA